MNSWEKTLYNYWHWDMYMQWQKDRKTKERKDSISAKKGEWEKRKMWWPKAIGRSPKQSETENK